MPTQELFMRSRNGIEFMPLFGMKPQKAFYWPVDFEAALRTAKLA